MLIYKKLFIVLLSVMAGASLLNAATWLVEAEAVGANPSRERQLPGVTPQAETWMLEKNPDASGGMLLSGTWGRETARLPLKIPQAGTYRIWVRHYQTPDAPTSFAIIIRNSLEEVAAYQTIDFKAAIVSPKGEIPVAASQPPADAKPPALVWTSFEVTFEYPTEATLSFTFALGQLKGKMGIDCVILSNDLAFNPEKDDWQKLGNEGCPLETAQPPKGMKPALPLEMHSSFFVGEPDREKQLQLGMCNAAQPNRDYPAILQLGYNRDHGWQNGSSKYGIHTMVRPDTTYPLTEMLKNHPAPEGRYANADGKTSDAFSNSFIPYRVESSAQTAKDILNFKDLDDVEAFILCGEGSGILDYGDTARTEFHKFLEKRFGTVAKLNVLWSTNYESFDKIPFPKNTDVNKAAWFSFREFSGLAYVDTLAEKRRAIIASDPKHRPVTSQAPCLGILAPGFTSVGPMDFEDLINVAFEGQPLFGYDAYSTGDYFVGCDTDLLLSFTGDRRLMNSEFNVHAQDPRIMARTYWSILSKGVKGITTWCYVPSPSMWMFVMWGMLNDDGTPREKLAAQADANHEVHRLEKLMGTAQPVMAVKPVALYYSRLDLSLPQTTFGVYSSAFDSPYRIYGILRALGYPVRWISPRQIEAGGLKDVGAVIMVGTKYVPAGAAVKLAQWVKDGGCIVGDDWPGALDEYDRPQTTLLDVFGIRPVENAQQMDVAKAKEALAQAETPVAGGLNPEVFRALNAEELFKQVEEMWSQPASKHPVAQAIPPWHLSGFDLKKINVNSGEVIGMSMGDGTAGLPSMVLNNYGKGHALYSAIMLGTMYESGPVAYEWDSTQEGPGLYHLLDAYLKYSGVKSFAKTGLPERQSWKTRIELPLADEKGNQMIGITSLNDAPLPAFPLTLDWHKQAPDLKMLLMVHEGSREIEKVSYEIKNGQLKLTMPRFDTHAALLALKDSDPLLSMKISGAPRVAAAILEVTPNTRLKIKATVWNPSPRILPAGNVKLYAAPGWFTNKQEVKVESVPAYGSRDIEFEVQAPAICGKRTLRPIVLKYEAGKVVSTPCTEIVWWTNPVQPVELSKN
ncbi:MAG: alpha-amylase family protein [Chthoniobacterales bacterium]